MGFISLLTPLAAVDESIEKLPSWAIPLRMVSLDLPKKTLERHFIFSEKALKNGMLAHNLINSVTATMSILSCGAFTHIYITVSRSILHPLHSPSPARGLRGNWTKFCMDD